MYNNFYYPLKRNEQNSILIKEIEQQANALFEEDIKTLKYTEFVLFDSTKSRVEYEISYMKHREMLSAFATMALLGEDEKWLLKLCDILWAICDEYTWAVPAHVPDEINPEKIVTKIDLLAAETAFYLSEIYHILGSQLPELIKERLKYELNRRIVEPYLSEKHIYGKSNWSAVCGSGVGCTLIYLGLDKEFEQAKDNILLNMEDFLDSYGTDGCCREGTLYWEYGFSYFCYFSELLKQYTNGEIDYFKDLRVKKSAFFGQNVYFGENYVISFSDSSHTEKYNPGFWNLLSEKYDGIIIPDKKHQSSFGDGVCYKVAHLIRNLYWTHPQNSVVEKDMRCIFYPDAQWYINKKNTYCFAAKGGHNREPHNHNDIGSFLVFDDGKYILDDVGWPEYDKEYFGVNRYKNMCASSLGHSVPVIDSNEQKCGKEYNAIVLKVTDDIFSIEFSNAYNLNVLKKLERTFELSENELKIKDSADGTYCVFCERFVTRIKPTISDNTIKIADYILSCDTIAKITLSEFRYNPRFSGFDGAEDQKVTAYLIDFELHDFKEAVFKLRKVK